MHAHGRRARGVTLGLLVACAALVVDDVATAAVTTPKKGVVAANYSGGTSRERALGASWYYNWSPWGATGTDVEFVPMIKTAEEANDWGAFWELSQGKQSGRYRNLLGFNEPDQPDQADMTVEEALDLWPRLESTGLRLGSPSPARYWNGWLDRFMAGAARRGYRVDFITLHTYPDWSNPDKAVSEVMTMINDAWRKWRKPIWLTEFGAIDLSSWNITMEGWPTHEGADEFMRLLTRQLEAMPAVERYSWLMDDCSSDWSCRFSTLYDGAGRMTSHGATYAGVGPVSDARVGVFRLINRNQPSVLHATGESYDPEYAATRRLVVSPSAWNAREQRWAVLSTGTGGYRLLSLAQPGAAVQPTADVYRWAGTHSVAGTPAAWRRTDQVWEIVDAGGGYVRIVNKVTGTALQATVDRYQSYADVYFAAATPSNAGNTQQQWQLVPSG